MKVSYITMPAVTIHSIPSPRQGPNFPSRLWNRARTIGSASFWLTLMALCVFLSTVQFVIIWHPSADDFDDVCDSGISQFPRNKLDAAEQPDEFLLPLLSHPLQKNMTVAEQEFWMQPDSGGYVPCLQFGGAYKQASVKIVNQKQRFLLVIVSGGLNQQRNQIVDAVVIARILEAALVIPVLQVNYIWGDESEFSDIFDVDHFKNTLKHDVRVVSSLPSTHMMARPVEERETPLHSTPEWFRSHYLKRLNREGVLLLRGLDSRLSEDLAPDLQKLRCKVAFHALRFAPAILEVGNRLSQRMWEKGPYVALHLRLEKDVWVRTGCLPGLGPKYEEEVRRQRILKPKLLTGRSNLTSEERKAAGLCPLNAAEVARLLKALGASPETNIFWAGGEPLGGELALHPLFAQFSHLYSKNSLALKGELEPFANKASMLAAIDYLICLNSDVFMPSHGGNMGRALQGHRAYAGHLKHITPNKREMLPLFSNTTLSTEEFESIIRDLHSESVGQPAFRTDKKGRDLIAFPVPECMCGGSSSSGSYKSSS